MTSTVGVFTLVPCSDTTRIGGTHLRNETAATERVANCTATPAGTGRCTAPLPTVMSNIFRPGYVALSITFLARSNLSGKHEELQVPNGRNTTCLHRTRPSILCSFAFWSESHFVLKTLSPEHLCSMLVGMKFMQWSCEENRASFLLNANINSYRQ